MFSSRSLLLVSVLFVATACAKPAAPTQPAGAPPTPKTVTAANPGGDANDPEFAALDRLAKEQWGFQRDFWNTLHIPLVDWKNWQRTRITGNPTRASFRYGKQHYAVATIWYTPIEGANDPEACMAKFIDYASPAADAYGIQVMSRERLRMTQSVGADVLPISVELLAGRLDSLLGRNDYLGAIIAYQSFPGTCLVEGFAVVATHHPTLAKQIRDRWVSEGATRLVWEKHVKEAPEPLSR
ncbi:MAG TPA: hypothetical protein PKA58_22335 [Polyangium sp.]|jgi:hypothetical protein|nr:hypothetical protein [Polyangium sp.]